MSYKFVQHTTYVSNSYGIMSSWHMSAQWLIRDSKGACWHMYISIYLYVCMYVYTNMPKVPPSSRARMAVRCCYCWGTLQHTATHCNTPLHTATHCNTSQHTAKHRNTLQHTATHCKTLQQTHMNTCWCCRDTLRT